MNHGPNSAKNQDTSRPKSQVLRNALLGFTGALIFLVGVFLVREFSSRSANTPSLAVVQGPEDSVTSLRVAYLGLNVSLRRGTQTWLVEGDDFPADTARVRRVLGYLLGLQTREEVSRDESGKSENLDLAAYSLDSANARAVEWTFADGRVFRVLLGKVSGIDFGSSFWKPRDEAVVYRTPGTFVFEVSSRPQDWKDTNLFVPFAPEDIRSLAVDWEDSNGVMQAYTLERVEAEGGSSFRLTRPTTAVADSQAAARLFRYSTHFKVDEFVPGVDAAATPERRASLETPMMTIRIQLKDGTTNVITAGAIVDGLYRYIKHPWHSDPVRVFLWRFDYFVKTGEELRKR